MSISPAIEFRKVSRFYGNQKANDQVSFSVQEGHIHGIVGENGAGKSTAMKLLFGLETPDTGEIYVFGKKVNFKNSIQAMKEGIGMVHQHFMLADEMTALENFLLFKENRSFLRKINWKEELALAQKISLEYGFPLRWELPVNKLSVGEQQRLEILKALSLKGKILILDEPTAVLTPQEADDFFSKLLELKSKGHTILIITHKLKEVLKLTDAVTVFRKGKVIQNFKTGSLSIDHLAEAMVGRKIFFEKRNLHPKNFKNEEVLKLENLQFKNQSLNIKSLHIQAGEIVGLAGVEGNGQKELIEFMASAKTFKNKIHEGVTFEVLGQNSLANINPEQVAFFPEDRLKVGSVASMNLAENFLLGHQKSFWISWPVVEQETLWSLKKFQINSEDPKAVFSSLSGGNQQKLVVARELSRNPQFILAAHPTRGVDIGAIEFIHEQLIQFQEKGAGIFLVSSELEELMKLSDRIYVIYRGNIVAEFSRKDFDERKIGAAMGGKDFIHA